jgi:alkyl hydroperoxide reductase subunit AhpC
MSLHIGSIAPDFEQDSTQGRIHFHEWLGQSWGILFSHPKDFTPVCTTELGRAANLRAEFEQRNVKVLAVSVDSLDSHRKWSSDIEETQNCQLDYPILADSDRQVARSYDMIHAEAGDTLTVRAVFFIDPAKKIRALITYPASTGRNFQEILRVIDSLQLTDSHKVATPADWKNGEDVVILPALQDPDELARRFPQGYRALRPYLRLTPQPNR